MSTMTKIMAFILAVTAAAIPLGSMPNGKTELTSNAAIEVVRYEGLKFQKVSNGLILMKEGELSGDIVIPAEVDGVRVIGIYGNVFAGNRSINSVTLPDTLYDIREKAFMGSSLKSINIPKLVYVIPESLFEDCDMLENVEFHDDIYIIAESAFRNTKIIPPENVKISSERISDSTSGDFIENNWKCDLYMKGGKPRVAIREYVGDETDVTLPEKISGRNIADMLGYTRFTSRKFTSFTFPESYQNIRFDLSNQPNLEKITVLNPQVDFYCYCYDTKLKEISVPASTIYQDQFSRCYELETAEFNGTADVLPVGKQAFCDCTKLANVKFGENYGSIEIEREAFLNAGLTSLDIKQSNKIVTRAFKDCTKLADVTLGDTSIESYTFSGCTSLKNVTFTGKADMEIYSFVSCPSIENVNIATTETITGSAFSGCSLLKTINSKPMVVDGEFVPECSEWLKKSFYDADDVGFLNEYVAAQVKKIVAENTTPEMTDMEKVKALHDWVCAHTKYGTKPDTSPEYHNDASILLNDETVCEGYSRMCNLLYNEAGIETYYIASHDHAWNIVKLGNHYFHVDSTWDDGDEISHDWFMKSDDFLNAAGGSHSDWKATVQSSMHSFQKDGTPTCEYDIGDVNMDGEVSTADLVTLSKHLLGSAPMESGDLVLGDMNFDGHTNAFDMVAMRKAVVSQ